jgi:hypothetical protein
MNTTIQAELPRELFSCAKAFVDEGWMGGFDELPAEALRRYLESHTADLTETYMREDVEWGLHGRD